MKIEIKKETALKCRYLITRADSSVEEIVLKTKTYLTHDICHYVVEKELKFEKGFWGMLSQGYKFDQLFGKENELTEELRIVEKVVGPIQSIYLGYFKKEEINMLLQYLDFQISEQLLDQCLTEIERILDRWTKLTVGEQIELNF